MYRIRILLLLLLSLAAGSAPAQSESAIEHRLDFSQRQLQMINVESRFSISQPELLLMMGNWNLGSYKIRDFARNVEGFQAEDEQGRSLNFAKTVKNRWRVEAAGAKSIVVRYRVYAAELTVRTCYVDQHMALINPVGVFMAPVDGLDQPHRIQLIQPADWADLVSPLPQTAAGVLAADSYHQLIDSPITLGNPRQYRFEVNGVGHRLVNFGETELWNGEQAARDLQAIAQAQADFWGQIPYRSDYLFLNFLTEGGGGLEHKNATVMLTSRWQMRDREDYLKWLSLASHELFHAWNVKRLRPLELGPFDYENEVYTRSLWIVEGITEYYETLLMIRAGLLQLDEFLQSVAEEIHSVESTPGRLVSSAEQASEDAWIKLYQADANFNNSSISYYRKGAVIGFLLDAGIRRVSRNDNSLDDVMRLAYQRYSGARGYSLQQFKDLISEVAEQDLGPWVDRLVNSTAELDLQPALDWYGLTLDRHPVKTALAEQELPIGADLGIKLDDKARSSVIKTVRHGTPAAEAGLLPGDEVIALNGERVDFYRYPEQLKRLRAGETVQVLFSRHFKIRQLQLQLIENLPTEYKLAPAEPIKSRQRRNLEHWIGRKLD